MVKTYELPRHHQPKRAIKALNAWGLKQGKDYSLIAPRRYGKTTLAEKILTQINELEQMC